MSDNNGNYRIELTDIGEGIAEVEVIEWPIKVGDSIKEDDVVCVVMTDKASVEIPSPVDGVVVRLGAEPGEMMAVGAELVRLQTDPSEANLTAEEAAAPPKSHSSTPSKEKQEPEAVEEATQPEPLPAKEPEPVAAPTPVSRSKATSTPSVPRKEGEKPIAAPAVRHRARQAGIDLRRIYGSGPAGRITHEDLDAFISGSQGQAGAASLTPLTAVDNIPVIGLRRKIANVMQDTMQRIPHFTYVEEVDVTELEALRGKLNKEKREDQPKLTLLPFLMRALVKAIRKYPQMSTRYNDVENIVEQYAAAHIGIATQTDKGLMVPVARHAEAMTIWDAANEVKRLSTAARGGTITAEELNGSTITITSLGPMGGIVHTPVINSPEVAIVGVNKISKRPVWQDGAFIPRDMMNLSSSFDHRIIDGWDATLFVQELKSLLESPATLFMEE
jgi:2-oxoisovalerate dehydrogenase E2 component (dihydrolipoyl transacylase)